LHKNSRIKANNDLISASLDGGLFLLRLCYCIF